MGGVDAAKELARKRRGKQFDPTLADLVDAEADIVLAGLDTTGTWDAVIDAEPALAILLSGERFDAALLAIANFVDLKSPYFLGHARAVAELAAEAGTGVGLDEADARTLRRAGLVHGFGRLGVSNAIWDKPNPVGAGEWERLRLYPYLTERMLRQSKALAPLAAIAVQHRERLDGSGYPRGLSGGGISRPARILGAADAYQAMCEPRPHWRAISADEAAVELRSEVKAGRYDAEAAEAVLGAAGHRVPRRREGPRPGRSPVTPSTSTRRSMLRRAPPRACSRCITAFCPRRASRRRRQPELGVATGQPACRACRLCMMISLVLRSSAAGLNCRYSLPGWLCTGM
jgi:HD domain-containing protein